MATKTITLEIDAYEKLRRAKRTGESFSVVVRRARFGPPDASGASILATLDGLIAREADHEALAYWERLGRASRPASESHWGEEEAL
ncbi:MAG: antitoxin VapB family protein [Verrucomicrobiae bacterium]|nr:antitoxin VapB family protein [Verrucomicrobiae bacterium]MCP5522738.1 antitoxin VapB family protein [Verrucomicrobiales bacterium]